MKTIMRIIMFFVLFAGLSCAGERNKSQAKFIPDGYLFPMSKVLICGQTLQQIELTTDRNMNIDNVSVTIKDKIEPIVTNATNTSFVNDSLYFTFAIKDCKKQIVFAGKFLFTKGEFAESKDIKPSSTIVLKGAFANGDATQSKVVDFSYSVGD